MSKYTKLQTEWFVDHEGIPDSVDTPQELVAQCEHKPETYSTGLTGREFCPRCGKVFGPTLSEYKYE